MTIVLRPDFLVPDTLLSTALADVLEWCETHIFCAILY